MAVKKEYDRKSVQKHPTITEFDQRLKKAVVVERKPTYPCPNCKAMSHFKDYCNVCNIDMSFEAYLAVKPNEAMNIRAVWKIKEDENGKKIKRKPKVEAKPKETKQE